MDSTSPPPLQPWREGLCGCFNDCSSCCIGCYFPCVQYGINAETLDGSGCLLNCCIYYCVTQVLCCCLVHVQRRQILRHKYGLAEDTCNDVCATMFCGPCAICQEAREMAVRGPPAPAIMSSTLTTPVIYGPTNPQTYTPPIQYAQQPQYGMPQQYYSQNEYPAN